MLIGMDDISAQFADFIEQYGTAKVWDHVSQLNVAALSQSPDEVFKLIDRLAEQYPDPQLGAAALIEIWELLISPPDNR